MPGKHTGMKVIMALHFYNSLFTTILQPMPNAVKGFAFIVKETLLETHMQVKARTALSLRTQTKILRAGKLSPLFEFLNPKSPQK